MLDKGSDVLVHCRGGLGRAGTVAARLLVEMGMDAEKAIAKVRKWRDRDAQPGNVRSQLGQGVRKPGAG